MQFGVHLPHIGPWHDGDTLRRIAEPQRVYTALQVNPDLLLHHQVGCQHRVGRCGCIAYPSAPSAVSSFIAAVHQKTHVGFTARSSGPARVESTARNDSQYDGGEHVKRTAIGLMILFLLPTLLAGCGDVTSGSQPIIPLKDAKLNIEHNATDNDTGFQGFIDSEGWKRLDVKGPDGVVLTFRGRGELGELGLTELFFESVEPANADVPIEEMLAKLPEGDYTIEGRAMENGESAGKTSGTAWLTHDIPEGAELLSPAAGATVPATGLVASWSPVAKTITGDDVTIIAYQLIIEKDVPPHPHMIGTFGLSMYLPASVTSIAVPDGFLEPGTAYKWEVLAIEESGNQTLSSGEFSTE